MERLGIRAGPLCISHLVSQDAYRTKRAQTRESEVAKRHRKSKQVVETHVEAVCVEAEELPMKLVVLNVNYKTTKKYLAHDMTLHTHLHIPACFKTSL